MTPRKITQSLKYFRMRSCLIKKKYNLFSAWIKCFKLLFIKEKCKPYKCLFESHYHIGHYKKKITEKNIKKCKRLIEFTILDKKEK